MTSTASSSVPLNHHSKQQSQQQQLLQQYAPGSSASAYRTANEARKQRLAQQNFEQQQHLFHKQRHEMLLQAVATRAPFLKEENDIRDQTATAFHRSSTEILHWSNRMAKLQSKKDFFKAKLTENVARVVHLEIKQMDVESEFEARRCMEVQEEKCRLMIRRVMQHDRYLLDCMLEQRRCIRAEERIRQCYENEEEQQREEYQKGYDLKPWQPYSQLFGVCPFHQKKDCPFHGAKKQRVLHFPMDPQHYCMSE